MTPQLTLMFAVCGVLCLVCATLTGSLLARLGFPMPDPRTRIGHVDGLRGYLALSVLLHHFYIWMIIARFGGLWLPPPINAINQLGVGSVAMFFMATGLVFYPKVLSGFRRTSWRAVYITRVFRLLPLVAVSFVIIAAIVAKHRPPFVDARFVMTAAKWIAAWSEPPIFGYPFSDLVNARVLWSLKYEWIFYLAVLPLCALAMDAVRSAGGADRVVPLGLLVLGGAGQLLLVMVGRSSDLFLYLPLFAIGMLAFDLQRRAGARRVLATPSMAIVAGVGLVVGVTVEPVPFGLSLPFFALFFCCVAAANDMGGLLATRGARVLGECSFGIYLLHAIPLFVLFTGRPSVTAGIPLMALPLLLPLLGILVTLATAVTYVTIERPAMNAGRMLARRLTHRAPPPASSPQIEAAP